MSDTNTTQGLFWQAKARKIQAERDQFGANAIALEVKWLDALNQIERLTGIVKHADKLAKAIKDCYIEHSHNIDYGNCDRVPELLDDYEKVRNGK